MKNQPNPPIDRAEVVIMALVALGLLAVVMG
jgi:hypothetical protein